MGLISDQDLSKRKIIRGNKISVLQYFTFRLMQIRPPEIQYNDLYISIENLEKLSTYMLIMQISENNLEYKITKKHQFIKLLYKPDSPKIFITIMTGINSL